MLQDKTVCCVCSCGGAAALACEENGRGASIRNSMLLFPFFNRVLGIVLFVMQVTIDHMSSPRTLEAGRIVLSRLPTRGSPRSSGGTRSTLQASSKRP